MYDIDEFDVRVDLFDAIKTYPILLYSHDLPLFLSMPLEVIAPTEPAIESIPRLEGSVVLEMSHHGSRNITSTKVMIRSECRGGLER